VTRIRWAPVIERAAAIVAEYDTSVTLRQLFYRLVSAQLIPNTQGAYKRLSELAAIGRRNDAFPDLIDLGRRVHRPLSFAGPADARQRLRSWYRRDRTENQDTSLYLGVEKAGMVEQLNAWFGEQGIPILAMGGYASQTYAKQVAAEVRAQDRPAVLLYAGDFDPSGEDIDRDFIERTSCWAKVIRVALTAEQVDTYGLPENPGKASDSRASGFVERHGRLVQVELDALDPNTLRGLFEAEVARFWDVSAYQAVLVQEQADLRDLGL
jgi:hypothetical protein